MKTYRIAPDETYEWYTGLTEGGRQALMGLDVNAEICVLFDSHGRMVKATERWFDRDGRPVAEAITDWPFHLTELGRQKVGERFQAWRRETIVTEQPIVVEEFGIDGRFIGIEPMPADYVDFLEAPESLDEDEREELCELIEDWKAGGLCVFWWNEDYWLNPDGSVNSH